jgi:hypothetical protein
MAKGRKVPRPVALHFGEGMVVEEAAYDGEHHSPAIQLIEFTKGDAAGQRSVRFCYYSKDGRFQRSPLMMGEGEIAEMRAALEATPQVRELLRQLVK